MEVCSFTDYFVICSGTSERMLRALAEEAQKAAKQTHGALARGIEGEPEGGWILIDYGDVILHLFSPAVRQYYQLEELWREGRTLVHMR